METRAKLALRFMSGAYKGGEFPLGPGREVEVGRGNDLDLVLPEKMVSRRHARISTAGDDVIIEDLGSTNGTFVNGCRIEQATLEAGDRVLIGGALMRVVEIDGEAPTREEARRALWSRRETARPGARMSGSLGEFPLPDLLQMLSTSRKTGALRIEAPAAGGAVHLEDGRIVRAELDGLPGAPARKALFRMLLWAEGTFDLGPRASDGPRELEASTEELVLDGLREMDELVRLADRLPGEDERLVVARPIERSGEEVGAVEREVLRAVEELGEVGAVIDRVGVTDYQVWKALVGLMEGGYLSLGPGYRLDSE